MQEPTRDDEITEDPPTGPTAEAPRSGPNDPPRCPHCGIVLSTAEIERSAVHVAICSAVSAPVDSGGVGGP